MLPMLSYEGKILMKTKSSMQLGPNGNGAFFHALKTNPSIMQSLDNGGVKYIHIIGVDNVMNRVLDPLFVGLAIKKELKVAAKACGKRSPDDKVGVIAQMDGKIDVIEYSEIGPTLSELTFADGELVYNEGSILIFLLAYDTLKDVILEGSVDALNSLYHVANKKGAYYDEETDTTVTPTEPNAYKLELFIHNFLAFVDDKFGVLRVKREDEFAPVKNPPGSDVDSPDTARAMMYD